MRGVEYLALICDRLLVVNCAWSWGVFMVAGEGGLKEWDVDILICLYLIYLELYRKNKVRRYKYISVQLRTVNFIAFTVFNEF